MNNNPHSFLIVLGIAFLGSLACGEKAPELVPDRPQTGATTATRGAPSWIDNEDALPDKVCAVGMAQPNALNDRSMQRDMALTDARAKLAAKLNARVHASASASTQMTQSATNQGTEVAASSSATRVQTTYTRQKADAMLVGAKPQQFWTDPKDGTLYVLLAVDQEGQ